MFLTRWFFLVVSTEWSHMAYALPFFITTCLSCIISAYLFPSFLFSLSCLPLLFILYPASCHQDDSSFTRVLFWWRKAEPAQSRWTDFLHDLGEGCQHAVDGSSTKPHLSKRTGDLQWRILHGFTSTNSCVSVLSVNVVNKCPFCSLTESIFHMFSKCIKLIPLF